MFELFVENERGLKVRLTQREDKFQIGNIDGLTPVEAEINETANANFDGSRFNSSRVPNRIITIYINLKGSVAENRNLLYQVFVTGAFVRLFLKTSLKNTFIEGRVKKFEGGLFENAELMVAEIDCQNPYFKEVGERVIDISKEFENFIFPFAINFNGIEFSRIDPARVTNIVNAGEVPTGVIITLKARLNGLEDPIIINDKDGSFFKINDTLNDGETIVINTNSGSKKVIKYDVDGVAKNIVDKVVDGSSWFKLAIGNNYFTYDTKRAVGETGDSVYLDVIFMYHNLFVGV